jgi:8-oxo-dGTP pyrophosphatase MutT (NUDIX family)
VAGRRRRGRPATEREFSAGGVVVREAPGASGSWECIVIVPSRRAANGSKVLALPKGHPDGAETPQEAALGEVRYWYQRDGRRIVKRVAFYLLRHEQGDPHSHQDEEIDEARWMDLEQAGGALTHSGEREMTRLALSQLASGR